MTILILIGLIVIFAAIYYFTELFFIINEIFHPIIYLIDFQGQKFKSVLLKDENGWYAYFDPQMKVGRIDLFFDGKVRTKGSYIVKWEYELINK